MTKDSPSTAVTVTIVQRNWCSVAPYARRAVRDAKR